MTSQPEDTEIESTSPAKGSWVRIPLMIIAVIGITGGLVSLIFRDHCQETVGVEWMSPVADWKAVEVIKQCTGQPFATDIMLFEKKNAGWENRKSILLMAGKITPEVTWRSATQLTIVHPEVKVLAKRSAWKEFEVEFEIQK